MNQIQKDINKILGDKIEELNSFAYELDISDPDRNQTEDFVSGIGIAIYLINKYFETLLFNLIFNIT
jgi:hypothetical protein